MVTKVPDLQAATGRRSLSGPSVVGPSIFAVQSEIRNPKPGTRDRKPEIWNLEPRTRNLKFETWNPEPETRNLEPGTRNPEPGTWNLKPET